jgi:regulator of sigma E protease
MDFLGVLNLLLSIVIGIILLVLLVVVHELGHAIAARRNGVVVEEFGIGFPPRAWAKKLKNGVLFTLNWLPLGGFVKLQGEHDAAHKKGDYGAASLWAKTKILLAGVVVNWLVAVIIFSGLAITGLPKFTGVIKDQFIVQSDVVEVKRPVTIAQVGDDSPAAKAGLEIGDELLRFNGQPIPEPDSLNALTLANRGKEVEIIYSRSGVEKSVSVQLNANNAEKKGYLGVGPAQRTLTKSTWSAPLVGVMTTYQLTEATLVNLGKTLGDFVTGVASKVSFNGETRADGDRKLDEVSNNIAGPIGILGVIFPAAREAGFDSLMLLTAIISLTLAVMNALPIPALDGGRWFVTMLFRVLRKPLTKELEERIHATGFMVLMGLVVLVTVADVSKLGR